MFEHCNLQCEHRYQAGIRQVEAVFLGCIHNICTIIAAEGVVLTVRTLDGNLVCWHVEVRMEHLNLIKISKMYLRIEENWKLQGFLLIYCDVKIQDDLKYQGFSLENRARICIDRQ